MNSLNNYPWPYYAELQARSSRLHRLTGYTWGLEAALEHLLEAIATGTVPADPNDLVSTLNRTIASAARLYRSRSSAIMLSPLAVEQTPEYGEHAAEAILRLVHIERIASPADRALMTDVGAGYTDIQIAQLRGLTAGAVRVRVSRLRRKLAA